MENDALKLNDLISMRVSDYIQKDALIISDKFREDYDGWKLIVVRSKVYYYNKWTKKVNFQEFQKPERVVVEIIESLFGKDFEVKTEYDLPKISTLYAMPKNMLGNIEEEGNLFELDTAILKYSLDNKNQ